MTTRPNLFDYATKELSQDAMICWLLKWAAKEHQELDRDLSNVGRALVNALLEKHETSPLAGIDSAEVRQQHHRIDVLAKINDTHVLLIEDKTDSADHSGQLERYYEAVRREHPSANIHPIYFKTGNYQHSEKCRVEEKGYKVFDRADFLKVLWKYKGANANLTDFRDYLQRLEDRTNSYKDWTKGATVGWEAWQGFFKHLEEKFEHAGWGYVPNPTGGFLGFWWGWNAHAYLQLQVQPGCVKQQDLCFKVGAGDADKTKQRRLKDEYHGRIQRAANGRVRRPPRMRIGKTMTVAQWASDWLAFGVDGKLDFERTVSNLREAEGVLKEAVGLTP